MLDVFKEYLSADFFYDDSFDYGENEPEEEDESEEDGEPEEQLLSSD
jgi:hypothetical protein